MNLRTLLLLGAALAGASGAAIAGEDSTDRLHGVGRAFYEVDGGLKRFAAGEPEQPRSEGCRPAS